MPSDNELLQCYVRDRSQEAFGELVRRHVDLVYSSALRRVGMDAQLAEDVTQEVFTELARRSASMLGRPVLEGWLYTTSRFKAVDLVRAVKRRRVRESLYMNANLETVAAEPDWEALRPLIDEVLDSLSKADREILILRYFRNRSFVDLAGLLSLTEDAARMRSMRALERLRAALAGRGIKSTAEALGLVLAQQAVGAAPLGLATRAAEGALAVAKGGVSATATALHLMNAAKVAMGVATVALLLASAATAVHEARAHGRTAALLVDAQQRAHAAEVRAQGVSRQLESAEHDESKLKSAVDAAASALEQARLKKEGATDIAAAGRDFIARNPDAQGLIIWHENARNAQRYAALFSSLGLARDKQSQFLGLVSQRSDLGLTWFTAPDTGAPAATLGAGPVLSADEIAARMRSLLGDDGYQAYQDFNRLGAAQALVQELAGTLYAGEAPISQSQGNQLVQVLAQSSADYRNGKPLWGTGQIGWDAALSNANSVLTEPQMDALRALRRTTAYEQAVNAAATQAAMQAMDSASAALASARATR